MNESLTIQDNRTDRVAGCLLGLAIGDALGTTLEFSERDKYPLHTEITGGGPFSLEAGKWTDDTSMALCIAASMLETNSFDVYDQKIRYVKWWREGYMSSTGRCFDIGTQIRQELDRFKNELDFGRDPGPFQYNPNNNASGNGGIMRLAPVAMAFCHNIELAGKMSALSSRTTHASKECQEGATVFGELLASAMQGQNKEQLLNRLDLLEPQVTAPHMKTICQKKFTNDVREKINASGYISASLYAALWAFYQTKSFEDGAILAVNLGGDADTVGAIYGQLAGAFYGKSGVPLRWLNVLYQADMITDFGNQIAANAGNFTVIEYPDY